MKSIALGLAAFTVLVPLTRARSASSEPGPTQRTTQNAVLVLVEGLRWQEVFHGAGPTTRRRVALTARASDR